MVLSAALIGGVLWLASGGAMQKKYDPYMAVSEESVAGLNLNAPVKYNGVAVGKVRTITLDPTNPERVQLVFSIERGTPIKQDTVAVLKTQGLTGIAYVELSGGGKDMPLLTAIEPNPYPLIATKPSLSARLENVLTTVLAKLDGMSTNVNAILSDENRIAFTSALTDIASVSRTVAARKEAIDTGITHAARTLDNSARISAQIAPIVDRIGNAATAVQTLSQEATKVTESAGKTITAAGTDIQRLTAETVPEFERLLGELSALTTSLKRLSEQTERNPASLLFGRSPVPNGPGEPSLKTPTP